MYKVIDAFKVRELTCLVLDREWDPSDLDKKHVSVGGIILDYVWQYNRRWVAVKVDNEQNLIGKELEFV